MRTESQIVLFYFDIMTSLTEELEMNHHKQLPPEFVKDGLELAKDFVLFGIPVASMTKEELIAVAAKGWYNYLSIEGYPRKEENI